MRQGTADARGRQVSGTDDTDENSDAVATSSRRVRRRVIESDEDDNSDAAVQLAGMFILYLFNL